MEIKDRIKQKAEELFRYYGIRSVTMDEIANHLGISKKTIYLTFEDKSELVDEITKDILETTEQDCIRCREMAHDAVHEIILTLGNVRNVIDQMNPSVLYDLERGYPKSFKRFLDFMYNFLFDVTIKNLKWGKEEGLFRMEVNEEVYTKIRLEAIPLPFNEKIFPKSKFVLWEVQ